MLGVGGGGAWQLFVIIQCLAQWAQWPSLSVISQGRINEKIYLLGDDEWRFFELLPDEVLGEEALLVILEIWEGFNAVQCWSCDEDLVQRYLEYKY